MIKQAINHFGTPVEDCLIDGNFIEATILREPITRADWTSHDYNVHFCIGLENTSDLTQEVTISINGGRLESLPEISPNLYWSTKPAGPFEPIPKTVSARTDLRKSYAITLPIGAKEQIFLANTIVRSPTTLVEEFDRIANESGAARRVIGKSCEGREIVGYIYGDPNTTATLLVSSGFHPPEPDTFATDEIMKFLGSPEASSILDKLAVAIVPIANPDGYANCTQGSNASGINFYWHFAKEVPDQCPEAAALWNFAMELAPSGYIDFHCYSFQNKKSAGPYQRPKIFHASATTQSACSYLYDTLKKNIPGKSVTGFSTFAPHTLGSMLVGQFDTLSLAKYHLHLAEGEDGCRHRGLKVFQAMAETIFKFNLTERRTKRKPGLRSPFLRLYILWSGLLRPLIGNLRRGRFKSIRLDRTAQLNPQITPGSNS
jgi:hypothetical protein